MAFDRVAVAIEAGVETIERISEWRRDGFANGAVAGDEGGVVEAFVAIVDVFKLVVEDCSAIKLTPLNTRLYDFKVDI